MFLVLKIMVFCFLLAILLVTLTFIKEKHQSKKVKPSVKQEGNKVSKNTVFIEIPSSLSFNKIKET